MVRCDEFYQKWQKAGNFCEKHPRTAEQIEEFLDKIVITLSKEVAQSEILAPEKPAIAQILTETASRPLISEKNPIVREKAIKHIVKIAEDKMIRGEKPQVTNKEVFDIVHMVKEGQVPVKRSEAPIGNIEVTAKQTTYIDKRRPEPTKQAQHKSVPSLNKTNDNIEWAKWSWNPVVGCKHNCMYCYARDIAIRFYNDFEPRYLPERLPAPKIASVPNGAEDDIGLKTIFVCSMADLFGEWVPQEWINSVLDVVRETPKWNFLFLTKNPKRLIDIDWPVNAWVGTTVDVQARVNAAQEAFKKVKAKVRFISCEPLQERLVFTDLSMFDWIIIGGRSRSTKLPEFQPKWEWVENIVTQARKDGLKIYFKPNLTVRPKEYPR
jgi:protein gp37